MLTRFFSQVHAGTAGQATNTSKKARESFWALHKCHKARVGTPRHLACTELWNAPCADGCSQTAQKT